MINEMKNSRSSDLLPMFYDCKYYFKKKKIFVLSQHIVTLSSSLIFLLSFLESSFTNIEHSAPIPLLVPNISGVKVACSSPTCSPYSLFLLFLSSQRWLLYQGPCRIQHLRERS